MKAILGACAALLLAVGLFARWVHEPAVYVVQQSWPEAGLEEPTDSVQVGERPAGDTPADTTTASAWPAPRSFDLAVRELDRAPAPEPTADDELTFAEEALRASRQLGESLAAHPGEPPPRAARADGGARGAPSIPVACTSLGGPCFSGGECCGGLTCAGAVAGYGIEGRCQVPR